MIILSNKPGQLGNLLIIYANFYSFAREFNIRIYNPAFYQYQSYFKYLNRPSKKINGLLYVFANVVARALAKLNIKTFLLGYKQLGWEERCELAVGPKVSGLNSRLCFVQGWQYRSDALINKYAKEIRERFVPLDEHVLKLNSFFQSHFSNSQETIIGIHIRQGDYKTFENGIYFYSLQQYLGLIKKLEILFEGKNPHFLICSNVQLERSAFANISSKLSFGPQHELLDMYAFARCHYLVGPPSTYSIWASFYGEVPLHLLHNMSQPIGLNDFKIFRSF